jgi:hypothetical protein
MRIKNYLHVVVFFFCFALNLRTRSVEHSGFFSILKFLTPYTLVKIIDVEILCVYG